MLLLIHLIIIDFWSFKTDWLESTLTYWKNNFAPFFCIDSRTADLETFWLEQLLNYEKFIYDFDTLLSIGMPRPLLSKKAATDLLY